MPSDTFDDIFKVMKCLHDELRTDKNDDVSQQARLLGIFTEIGRTLANADRASFWRWDKQNQRLITVSATGTKQLSIADTSGIAGHVLKEKKPIVVNDPYHHPSFNPEIDAQTGYVTKSILAVPVLDSRGESIGVLQVINKLPNGSKFDCSIDVKRLETASIICGMVLGSGMFFDDPKRNRLTKLKNRFGFRADCETRYRAFFQGSDHAPTLSIIMCDIDDLKKINDDYGRKAGDAAMVHISRLLKQELRDCDSVYMWANGGGFLVVLEGATIDDAAYTAEHIRLVVEDSVCHFCGNALTMTMSFGCAEVIPTLSIEENMKVAHSRLYHAKETGKNRVASQVMNPVLFERYFDPRIMNELVADDSEAFRLGGKLQNVAVLFVDIRGFTKMSEELPASAIVDILNHYLGMAIECIRRHHGTLDKFIGDCAMAFWNAPLKQENPVLLACRAAMNMIDSAGELNRKISERYGREISFGIGVHWGSAIVGNIGSSVRMDYTAIGDTVNTAARLEANAPGGEIYVSRIVADILGTDACVETVGRTVRLKGKADGFEVLRLKSLRKEGDAAITAENKYNKMRNDFCGRFLGSDHIM